MLWFEQLRQRFSGKILPIDEETSLVWGGLFAHMSREGKPCPAIDGLIAATARARIHGGNNMSKNSYQEFLGSADPVVAYNAACFSGASESALRGLRPAMLADPRVRALVEGLEDWPGEVLSSHKSATQAFHRLSFLADIGVRAGDLGMGKIVQKILSGLDENGIPQLPMKIGAAHGGNGTDTMAWALCDAPTTLSALLRMGADRHKIEGAVEALSLLFNAESGHWGCAVSPALKHWRGPGKKADPCPYATLVMLKLLVSADPMRYRAQIAAGAKTLLSLWEQSRERHPYIFYMGTDFRKLKLPLIWYDILHVVHVLSSIPDVIYPGLRKHKAFKEMRAVIAAKRSAAGFVPESVYLPWKDWDFGQKKAPSNLLGLFVLRALEA